MCLSRVSYYIAQVIENVIEPYMVNSTQANWKGKTSFFWDGTSFLCFVWAFFRLPETKNLSYEELDILCTNRVSARRFASFSVDACADEPESRIEI